jgi:antitoxin component of MazEF toxin-antitoxin module
MSTKEFFSQGWSNVMSTLNEQVLTLGDPAELVISQDILKQIGVGAGDKVEVAVSDGAVIVRPLEEAERARKIAAATRDIFDRRREAYLKLAEGPE